MRDPDPDATLFLRACLHSGDTARDAWERWVAAVGSPLTALGDASLRRLGPLLHHSVRRNGLEVERRLLTTLRTASLRENLRAAAVAAETRRALDALAAAGVAPVVLRGVVLAETVYPAPALRHCHDLDLLVEPAELERARSAVDAAGLHLAVSLHTALLPPGVDEARMRARARPLRLAGVPARGLAAPDLLLHVLGHGPARSRPPVWAPDAWFLLTGPEAPDWESVHAARRSARRSVRAALRYLRDGLGAPVPEEAVAAGSRRLRTVLGR